MHRFSLLLTCAVLAVPVYLSAAEPGKVEGKMVVEGKATTLTHVYAIAVPTESREKLFRIIFSDAPITDADLLLFPDSILGRINDGKLHALRVSFAKTETDTSLELYDATVGISVISDPKQLVTTTFTDKLLAGRLHLTKPYTDAGGTYDYDLKFSVPIRDEEELKP